MSETWPSIVTLAGRAKDKENQDLQGEYHRISVPALVHGRPAYRKPGARTVLRYWTSADRWLIDRAGLQDSDACSAYAEQAGALHPAREDLVWRVWETAQGQHIRDPELVATSAPLRVQVVGRGRAEENADLNGEYRLRGLHQGCVFYRKADEEEHVIRYWASGDRWLIDLQGLRDVDVCNAFAEANGALHPATLAAPGAAGPSTGPLQWHVWDSARRRHVQDEHLAVIATPAVVELQGRDGPRENVNMNGSYHLFGLHAGRPAYMKADGSGHAIRYWAKEDRWLVDFDGLRDADVCNAYAESQGSCGHPGEPGLVWNIWESGQGRHIADPAVSSFVAPHWVRISGRDASSENAAINGDYTLVALTEGKAAYQKEGCSHVIRYWKAEDRWIIDLEHGFSGGDVANAYADAKGAESPGNLDLVWHVWDTGEAKHIIDEHVVAEGLFFSPVDWFRILGCGASAGAIAAAPSSTSTLPSVSPSAARGCAVGGGEAAAAPRGGG